ncbi:CSA protein [Acanthamoeba castellanii str. Neff]|uniref:CSA protein n=1 Tax=Acanthamoeba castellanii (strain ATCC 30010 / Neff) TaxID=1257118 RepID=L8HF88_ACACF|nr:CSA protein [Acanthamoeba castellanii str. Neff]ELR23835.1 CSA protein [Acanthamoeba castellanii str. Neff]
MARAEAARRAYDLDLSGKREITSANHAAFTSLAIDLVEARYLLAGAGDGTISVFDLHQFGGNPRRRAAITPLFLAKRGGHTHGVSSIAWYTHDTGMFFSGSFDHKVNAWDTNAQRVVCQFEMPLPVYSISLSPIATRHALVAAGSGDQKVRLCDPMTGGSTHCLLGHREAILAVQWSPTNEYLLASASVDKTIRLWDIRRSGCLLSLDQHNSQTALETNRTLRLKNVSAKGGAPTSVTAHDEPVTSLCWSPDGLFLYSSGKDNKIHMWNADTGRNTLVNFAGVKNAAEKGSQMAISSDGQVLYHPNGSDILALEAHTGRTLSLLRGHFDKVNCCVFHPHLQELYSGGNDNQLLCWVPSMDEAELVEDEATDEGDERQQSSSAAHTQDVDGDAWSDEEEDEMDG